LNGMSYSKLAVLGIAFILVGCASSTPYLEDRGPTQVVTEPPDEADMADTEAPAPVPPPPTKTKKTKKKPKPPAQ
jgi:PBP1b-binding outer membrane lipoprotein LpoB